MNVTSGERVFCNHAAQVVRSTQNYIRVKTEPLFNSSLNAFRQNTKISFGTFENDIAALYVSLRITQLQRRIKGSQILHLDPLVRPEVHATKHRDDDRHELQHN